MLQKVRENSIHLFCSFLPTASVPFLGHPRGGWSVSSEILIRFFEVRMLHFATLHPMGY